MLSSMRALLILPLLLTLACTSAAAPVVEAPSTTVGESSGQWRDVGPGMSYARFGNGVEQSYHVTRVNLDNDEIVFFGSSEDDRGRTVGEFAAAHSALVAINGDYFDEWLSPVGPTRGFCGDWQVRAPPVSRRQPVFVAGAGRASILDAEDAIPDWANAAVSGWPRVVTGCKAQSATELPGSDSFTRAPHPRTAVGLSRDGRTVFLVVADLVRDGRFGVTLEQLGIFMREELGACEALNLDGGGSSAMAVGERTVSRPKSGVERHVANHLAVGLRQSAPSCPSASGGGTADWSGVSNRVGLELIESRPGSARLKLPYEDGEVMLLRSGSDLIATGTLVTTPEIAKRLEEALRDAVRVSWTTPIDARQSRVQLGGRATPAEIEAGLRVLAAPVE